MTTYIELKSQADALMARAEQIRAEERAGIIATIMELLRENGLTVEDLAMASRKPAANKTKAPAKYRGPNGELWSGGPGRKPDWVKAVLEAGESLEQYLLPAVEV